MKLREKTFFFQGSNITGGFGSHRFCWSAVDAKSNLHEKNKTNDMDNATHQYKFDVCSFILDYFDPHRKAEYILWTF